MDRRLKVMTAAIGVAVLLAPQVFAMQAQSNIPLNKDWQPRAYQLGPSDTLTITFTGLSPEDRLDMNGKPYVVAADGSIQLKFVGALKVQGLTENDVMEQIKKALMPKFYQDGVVNVDVVVTEQRKQTVSVQGQVVSPGSKELSGREMTAGRAINAAGSFTQNAGQEIEIRRRGPDGSVKVIATITKTDLNNAEDFPLQEDDEVYVKTGEFFYVSGHVNNQGKKPWEPGMTVAKALIIAGGFTSKGKLGYIDRPEKNPDGTVKKYNKVKNLKPETTIQPDDILVIAQKWIGGF